jgi:hypothetical protein
LVGRHLVISTVQCNSIKSHLQHQLS